MLDAARPWRPKEKCSAYGDRANPELRGDRPFLRTQSQLSKGHRPTSGSRECLGRSSFSKWRPGGADCPQANAVTIRLSGSSFPPNSLKGQYSQKYDICTRAPDLCTKGKLLNNSVFIF